MSARVMMNIARDGMHIVRARVMNILDQTGLLDCKAEYKIYMYMLRAATCASASPAKTLRMLTASSHACEGGVGAARQLGG